MKKMAIHACVAGFLAAGCGSHSTSGSSDSAGSALSADGGQQGTAPQTVGAAADPGEPSVSSTCAKTAVGNDGALTFSSTLACRDETAGSCPLEPLTLKASTGSDSSGVTTTTWTVSRGSTPVLTRTSRSDHGVTTTEIDRGAPYDGIKKVVFSDDGSFLTGSFDGREFLPVPVSNGVINGSLAFGDLQGDPVPREVAGTTEAVFRLLGQAHTDVPVSCSGAASAANPASAAAIARLESALPSVGTIPPPASQPVAKISVGTVTVDALPFAPQGVPTDFTGSTGQNSPINFQTHDCQRCEHDCVNSALIEIITLGTYSLACSLNCFYPGNSCAEDFCGLGKGSCDSGDQCCGHVCCGPGTVCGDSDLGECCPSDHPVGCGDVTGVTCFAAGSNCCGNLDTACPKGVSCTNVTALTATCCAPANQATDGDCCAEPACGGQCCGSGVSCVNDQCCFGPINSAEQCCSGFGESACGSSCCDQSETCTGSTCCPAAQACGGSCCEAGQACVNGACQGCGAGTVACSVPGSSALCCPSGATCSATACCPADEPFCPFNQECSTVCIPPP